MIEGITFLSRAPRRGDVAVFKTDGIALLPAGSIWIKRVVGEPGDHVRIANGKIYINGKHVVLENATGEITYLPPHAKFLTSSSELKVPEGCYFLLGDNSVNSLDSRFWGSVPRENILGLAWFCYWPWHRWGGIK